MSPFTVTLSNGCIEYTADGQSMNFARSIVSNMVRDRVSDVLVVEGQRHLTAVLAVGHPLERIAADEIVVELDEVTVTQIPRGEVIILDVGGDEAAADRRRAFVSGRGQPFPVGRSSSPV